MDFNCEERIRLLKEIASESKDKSHLFYALICSSMPKRNLKK